MRLGRNTIKRDKNCIRNINLQLPKRISPEKHNKRNHFQSTMLLFSPDKHLQSKIEEISWTTPVEKKR